MRMFYLFGFSEPTPCRGGASLCRSFLSNMRKRINLTP